MVCLSVNVAAIVVVVAVAVVAIVVRSGDILSKCNNAQSLDG
jgi:hypothetical protein